MGVVSVIVNGEMSTCKKMLGRIEAANALERLDDSGLVGRLSGRLER